MILGRDAVTGYAWMDEPAIQAVPAPERVFYDARDREEIERHERDRPRVGFAPPPRVVEPLLWEGDDA